MNSDYDTFGSGAKDFGEMIGLGKIIRRIKKAMQPKKYPRLTIEMQKGNRVVFECKKLQFELRNELNEDWKKEKPLSLVEGKFEITGVLK